MRLLQTRQARRRLLGVLNYMVSIQRRLALDGKGMAFPADPPEPEPAPKTEGNDGNVTSNVSLVSASTRVGPDTSVVSSGGGGGGGGGGGDLIGGKVKKHQLNVKASDYSKDPAEVMAFKGIQLRDDSYYIDREDIVRVRDAVGTQVMYSEAVRQEATLRDEMLLIGTHYLQKFKDKGVADRAAVLEDLFQSEAAFYEGLKLVLDVYVECYEHCTDEQSQKRLAQTMTTLMTRRPVLDLNLPYLSGNIVHLLTVS